MLTFKMPQGFSEFYVHITTTVLRLGDVVIPRGKRTKEVRPVLFEIEKPRNRVTTVHGRDINTFFLIAEALWILSGKEDVETLVPFNSNIKQFSDDGNFFHGAYGARLRHYGESIEHKTYAYMSSYDMDTKALVKLHDIRQELSIDQLKGVCQTLHNDMNSRQAVVSIWSPFYDLGVPSKDIPCNDFILFKVRGGRLDMTVINRSNDLHWGVPTNIFQFSMVQEIIAYVLELEIGVYRHFTDSLHIYEEDYSRDITNRILQTPSSEQRLLENNIYNIFQPSHFSLNVTFKSFCSDVSSNYDQVFTAIEEAQLYVEDFENMYESFKKDVKTAGLDKLDGLFAYHFLSSIAETVQKKSNYLWGLCYIVLTYFLYKKAVACLKKQEEKEFGFSLLSKVSKMLFEIGIEQKDMLVSCMNFIYTRFVKASAEYPEMKMIISFFEKRLSKWLSGQLNSFETNIVLDFITESKKPWEN